MAIKRVTIEGKSELEPYVDFDLRTSDGGKMRLIRCGIIKIVYEGELVDEENGSRSKAQLCVDADSPHVGTLVTP